MVFRYRPEVLDALADHGLRPRPETTPDALRDAVNGLYRYEIRRLRRRLLAGEFPKAEYIGRVIELRKKYFLLSIRRELWTE
jgi:hypothetical protein